MKEIMRFPREETLHVKGERNAYGMNDVHLGLRRLAAGKKIGPRRMVLLCTWFGLNIVNQYMAKQIIRQLKEGKKIKIRFPRRKNGS